MKKLLLIGTVSLMAITSAMANGPLEMYFQQQIEKAREPYVRQQQELAKAQEAERQRQEAEKARIANLPVNRVLNGYIDYAYVKLCHDVREGYLVQFVSDAELERAETAIKAIVEKATAEDTTIDTNAQWQQAIVNVNKMSYTSIDYCQFRLGDLLRKSPKPVYSIAKP